MNNEQPDTTARKSLDFQTLLLKSVMPSINPGSLYLISAQPGAGKSSFALRLVRDLVIREEPKRILYLSLDLDRWSIVQKLVIAVTSQPFEDFEDNQEALGHINDLLELLPLNIRHVPDATVPKLGKIVLDTKDIDLVIIDDLDHIDGAIGDDRNPPTAQIKQIAKQLHVPIICMASQKERSVIGVDAAFRLELAGDQSGGDEVAVRFDSRKNGTELVFYKEKMEFGFSASALRTCN